MVSDYRTTIGGALSALGKTLMGVGIVPQLSGTPNTYLTVCAAIGFVLDAIGGFFAHLFAADAKEVRQLTAQVNQNAVAQITGDTTLVRKNPEPEVTKGP
jgi:hypothetical protein